jgi:LmbE family N-acetylglucosaminyl deacetylase
MLSLTLPFDTSSTFNVLCVGAHSDDIEIGCGGTILRLARKYPNCVFHWVVFSANGLRADEAQRAARLLVGEKSLRRPVIKSFKDGFMPFVGAEVKATFEELKPLSPDLIFTHYRKDAHQDHRLLSELTWQTFRNHLILEYEIAKYDGDLGQPNLFVALDKDDCHKKINCLMDAFESQKGKHWFEQEAFLALMRLRGIECCSPSGYAEAFYCHKVAL